MRARKDQRHEPGMKSMKGRQCWRRIVGILLLFGACLAQAQTVTPEQFGAVGDGIHDDTEAFAAAAGQIYTNGGGTFVLAKGKTYRVGRQERGTNEWPFSFYRPVPMFRLYNAGKAKKPNLRLTIEGHGATVKLNDGLRIGAFDKDTGAALGTTRHFTDRACRAQPGHMFDLTGCDSVEIRDLNLNGNVSHLTRGGVWGDTGYQCSASGFTLSDCERIRIDNVVSSHCGLDGIMLVDWERCSSNQDWAISNSRFEYNARQGLSWCGGTNLTVTNCKFNHTGRDTIASAPGAGLDIEAESSPIRNGTFISCEFVDNRGCAMVADTGNSADVTFEKCLFWGTTQWSIWAKKPGFRFTECVFHGQAANAYGDPDPERATRFKNCRFEDVYDAPYEGGSYSSYAYPGNELLIGGVGENVLFDGCTLIANRVGSGVFGKEYGGPAIIRGCDITHKSSAPRYRGTQCSLLNVDIRDTRFHESLKPGGEEFVIRIGETISVGPGVWVDGPSCRWGGRGANGIVGEIPSKPTVVRNPSIVVPGGESITAVVRYGPGKAGDWVGLYAAGDDDSKRGAWQYLNGLQTAPAAGSATATLSFPVPSAAGKYELRLFAGDGGMRAAVSQPIVVSGVTLTVETARVQAGEPIVVHVRDVPPNDGVVSTKKNWVGLYDADAADDAFSTKRQNNGRVAWQYLNGLQEAPEALPASAVLTFEAPVTPGAYDFRFFLEYHRQRCLAKSARVTVYAPEK
jgi:hypothetical protein